MTQDDIGDRLLRGQRRQTVAICVVFVALIGIVFYVWVREGQTRDSLCTLRGDLVQRVDDSRAFLASHPHGIPGVSAASIQVGIDNQQRTIDALSGLHCDTSTLKG